MSTREHRLIPTPEAAAELGISARTLQRYAAAGVLIPALRLPSGHLRWRLGDLVAQLGQGRTRGT